MPPILLGNLFSVLATGTDVLSASRKSPRSMLLWQTASQFFLALTSLVLGGYSAVVQNVVSMVRNLTALCKRGGKAVEYGLIVLGVALGAIFNNLGLLGWLPIVANLEYSVAVFRFRDNERLLKIAFAACIVLYTLFNLAIRNYVGALSNTAVLITTVVSIVRSRRDA